MLSNFFIVLFLFFFAMLIWGLISPRSLSKNSKKSINRKEVALGFGTICIVLLVLIGITTPKPKDNQQNIESNTQYQKIEPEPKKQEVQIDPRYYWHEVIRVIDGDTLVARVDSKEETIRVIGIDAPENSTKECYNQESTDKAKEFLNGKWIQLEKDNSQDNRDKYGRLLRYVWFDSGTDFGRRLIEEGYAYEYTYKSAYSKQSQYKATQATAKNNKYGFWNQETCNGQRQKPQEEKKPTVTPNPPPQPQPSYNSSNSSNGVVKKSKTGICHAPGTTYYDRTTNYTGYSSLQECLNSGGRLPKR